MNKILLDMDGVVSDFTSMAAKLYSHTLEELLAKAKKGSYYVFDDALGIGQEEFDNTLAFTNENFWAELPMTSASCYSGKVKWLRKFTGDPKFKDIIFTDQKHLLARSDRLLIDDCADNCDSFWNCGGESILFPRFWNRNYSEEYRCAEYTYDKVRQLAYYQPAS